MAHAYDPSYPTCSYTHVWLRVMGEALDLDETSALLGVEPTSFVRVGERRSSKSDHRYKATGWFLESAGHVESRDSRDHFAWLLERLSERGEVLRGLVKRGFLVDICCRWDSASGHGGPTMPSEQLARLGLLGVEVWFDVYFDGKPIGSAR